ncbi:hypothetical protein EDC56_3637 [Sinobacterium caligoides]|uniref:Uncharacterized protein n=1 Tax=Sinobacterium caligoides TaxID=933926 RepID=A0A3N2DE89_9GAMM|nr:hypothetical protein [Sinobacterium caligoides]ROR97968.1 hypothetical protein EDC56_3637 [Sinobacterium caligoides]
MSQMKQLQASNHIIVLALIIFGGSTYFSYFVEGLALAAAVSSHIVMVLSATAFKVGCILKLYLSHRAV